MIYHVHIDGNHENPMGNAVPYVRMTQRGKFVKGSAQRYIAWIKFLQWEWLRQTGTPLPTQKGGYWSLTVFCAFKGEGHADVDNVAKGVQDAIFKLSGDKHVAMSGDFKHVDEQPYLDFYVRACSPK